MPGQEDQVRWNVPWQKKGMIIRMKTNQLTVGILAHVDSGKTTLAESILYISGAIRKLGRVDHKDVHS